MGDAADDMTAAMEAGETLCYLTGGRVVSVDNVELMYGGLFRGVPLENCTLAQRREIKENYKLKSASLRYLRDVFDP